MATQAGADAAAEAGAEAFAIRTSRGFPERIAGFGGSLVFTTYQRGKVLFIGSAPNGQLNVFERTFPRAMGVAISDDFQRFALATKDRIYEFDNLLAPGDRMGGFDAYFAPHSVWITGSVDTHDMAYGPDGLPMFCATKFNCLARVTRGYSFEPIWTPPFISTLVAEDRCHLNGFDVQGGTLRHVTCVSQTDQMDGWREHRDGGGCVLDGQSGQILVDGLSMPHSPRSHGGKLWLLNSGTGELGWVAEGRFHPLTVLPGFARGLCFVDGYAIVGLSEPRDGKTFSGLPLQDVLQDRAMTPRCGLAIVDLASGEIVDWLFVDGVVTELFDVGFFKGLKAISLVGIRDDEIAKTISLKPKAAPPR